MGLILNGNEPSKILYNGAEVSLYFNGSKIWPVTPVLDEITIGTQTWKIKNLSIDDGQGGIYTQTVNYGQGNVVEYYYTWEAALRVASTVTGWHLPTRAEWDTLATAVGSNAGKKLKATYGWAYDANGTDEFGFRGFPAGLWNSDSFKYLSTNELFWTATEYSSTKAYNRMLGTGSSLISDNNDKTLGYSVRLIKDAA